MLKTCQIYADLEKEAKLPLPPAAQVQTAFKKSGETVPTPAARREEILQNPHFGSHFTDHMALAQWSAKNGWHERQIVPFGPFSLSPAASVLHYGQEIFEGIKAYAHPDGSVWTFRPGYNAARLRQSARRLMMPEISNEDFLGSLVTLVRTDRQWVPTAVSAALYLRPFMVATEPFLGVRSATEYTYCVIASPAGPYFEDEGAGVSIYVTQSFHRAFPGGTGAAKCGGNYAGSLLPQVEAAQKGYQQVCFLDASGRYLEELGGMNVFVVYEDGHVETPRLTGTILAGGTRSSIITLLRGNGREVTECDIALQTLLERIRTGQVTEVFACGTAAVVAPIGKLGGADFVVEVPQGSLTKQVHDELTGIQFGLRPDTHGWLYRLC
ncbi:MAG: branched-chain amino acid aminotransferase [Actinomycetaceae bacterium]|nr:branched-chain amino acid aminotransferase [Actinomycetaceae bacterium]